MGCGIFILNHLVPIDGDLCHIVEVLLDAGNVFFHAHDGLIGFLLVEFKDTRHLDFQ